LRPPRRQRIKWLSKPASVTTSEHSLRLTSETISVEHECLQKSSVKVSTPSSWRRRGFRQWLNLGALLLLAAWTLGAVTAEARGDSKRVQTSEVRRAVFLELEEGKSLNDKRQYEEASVALRATYRKASGPMRSWVAVELARALLFMTRRAEALELIKLALDNVDRSERELLLERARSLSETFLKTEWSQQYERALRLMKDGNYPLAREQLEKLLESERDHPELLLRLGQVLLLQGVVDLAAERLREAARLASWEPEARLWAGRALQVRGEYALALKEFEAALELSGGLEAAWFWMGECLNELGSKRRSLEVLSQAVKRNPQFRMLPLLRLKTQIEWELLEPARRAKREKQWAAEWKVLSGASEKTLLFRHSDRTQRYQLPVSHDLSSLRRDIDKLIFRGGA
jgi:tetratricopeptide (TPR) repeat protein